MTKKRYALIGTGSRAQFFVDSLARFDGANELVALCDPNATRLAYTNQRLAGELGRRAVPAYPAGEFDRMVREQHPDVVIVTSKDSTHHEYIVRALRLGCDVITEKPMTIDAPKCRSILDAVKETGRNVRVAFNCRWSPHRTKVKELLLQGTIGAVKHVNVEYVLNTAHGADYYRRWHANLANSGGLLVHKSTHHFDLVNWWLDAIPEQIFAYGRLDYYGRANAIARGDEAWTRYERYTNRHEAEQDPFRYDLTNSPELQAMYLEAEKEDGYLRDQNVFREGIDIYDNMTVLVRYRSAQLLTYSLLSFSPREGMRVGFDGEHGRIEYEERVPTHIAPGNEPDERSAEDAGGQSIRVFPHFKPSYEVAVANRPGDHNGSDPGMAEDLFTASAPVDRFARQAGHEQAAASIMIGICANESIATNRPVNVQDLVPLPPGATKLSELS